MDFTAKYISTKDAALDLKTTKIILSNDAFAIGEAIAELINKIEHARMSLMK